MRGLGLVIHKCCPEDEVFDHFTKSCQPSHDLTFSVPIFTVDYYGVYMESNLTRDQVSEGGSGRVAGCWREESR